MYFLSVLQYAANQSIALFLTFYETASVSPTDTSKLKSGAVTLISMMTIVSSL